MSFFKLPRISRAQNLDALSSQANLLGYASVLRAAKETSDVVPMMTTAAGNIQPSKVLILGVGVAGLQAIATAKRLGARVWAFDIRKEAKDQVESLGAKFVEASTEAQDSVYAQEVSEEENQKIQEALKKQVIDSDIVLTFAQIPGKKAPVLIEKSTIEKMKKNSVIIDLAAGTGGNCEGTVVNKVVELNGVKIVGETDILNSVKHAATKLYSENVRNLIELYIENSDDEILQNEFIMEATFLLTLLITFLASFIGYELISKIPQTLHTPLMSGSNAISGITLIAAILIYPEVRESQILQIIVLIAISFATLNIVGGFSVTGRILEMFKKND